MATFTERLAYVITANAKDAVRAFRDVRQSAQRDLGGAEAAIGGFGANAKNLGQGLKAAGAGLLGVGGASAAFNVLNEGIDAASSLEQAVGGTVAVFGDAGDAIDDYAQRAADGIGLSERAFREATTLIGGQLKRMTGDVTFAAEESVRLTQVAADLAATYGGTTAEAVEALGSAFRGEADPAERFNLNLKAGAVSAKAVELGLAASRTEVSENARAMATLALIYEQSADAQGQFARESDSAAGSQARFDATLENLKATLGEGVLPAVAAFTDGLTMLTAAAEKASEPVGGVSNVIRGLVKGMPGLGSLVQLKDALTDSGDEAEEAAPKIDNVPDAIEKVEPAVDAAVPSLREFRAELENAYDAQLNLGDASANLAEAEQRVRDTLDGTADAAAGATAKVKTYQEVLDDVLGAAVDVDLAHESAADAVRGLAEALGQAGVGSEDSGDFMDRFNGRGKDAEEAGKSVVEATADAVKAAQDEVDAMAESGEIADTAAARKEALRQKLIALKEQFPQVAGQIDRYLGRLDSVSSNLPTVEQQTDNLARAKRDLAEDTRDLIRAAGDEVDALAEAGEIADTAKGKHFALLGILEDLKTRFPELAAIIETYVADVNEAWKDYIEAVNPPGDRAPGTRFREEDTGIKATAPVVNFNYEINGAGLDSEAVAELTHRKTQRALVGARVG